MIKKTEILHVFIMIFIWLAFWYVNTKYSKFSEVYVYSSFIWLMITISRVAIDYLKSRNIIKTNQFALPIFSSTLFVATTTGFYLLAVGEQKMSMFVIVIGGIIIGGIGFFLLSTMQP